MLHHCKGIIAHYKIPRYLMVVDEYPLTVTGKVRKNVIRDEMNDAISSGKIDVLNGLKQAQ